MTASGLEKKIETSPSHLTGFGEYTLLWYTFSVEGNVQFILFYVAFVFVFIISFPKDKRTHLMLCVVFIWNWMNIFSKEFFLDLFHYFQFSMFKRKELIEIAGSMINCKTM